ncbi:MAG: hypothetical protein H6813_07000 [Phycisphaeraceae bacterium]|nr:hypothetical protein [Phycisphaeraceae bacterium]MCB9848683.1 hypothetical protein [Phycisphaeraceae bacterium]
MQHTRLTIGLTALLTLTAPIARADVERYKVESEYLARLAELGLDTVQEGFESSVWDGTHNLQPVLDPHYLFDVTNQGIIWEPAAKDIWPVYSSLQHGLSTTPNWARTGGWGSYENHRGEGYPTTIRVSAEVPIYGVGWWYDTNPNGQSVGLLFEDATTANAPGYVLGNLGAMYPGDNPTSSGHEFVGFVDPDGFTSAVLTGTLQVNEKGFLEGGVGFGTDDVTFGVPQGFNTPPCTGDIYGDGVIDTADLGLLLNDFGSASVQSDLNNDGVVDTADLGQLLSVFGSPCP